MSDPGDYEMAMWAFRKWQETEDGQAVMETYNKPDTMRASFHAGWLIARSQFPPSKDKV